MEGTGIAADNPDILEAAQDIDVIVKAVLQGMEVVLVDSCVFWVVWLFVAEATISVSVRVISKYYDYVLFSVEEVKDYTISPSAY